MSLGKPFSVQGINPFDTAITNYLTLPEEASGIDIEKVGAFKACPFKNLFWNHFDPFFGHG